MKNLLLILIIVLFSGNSLVFAQFEFRTQYQYSQAMGPISLNVNQAHGIIMQGVYQLPKSPVLLGLELGFSGYGHQKQRQTYNFDDGTQTETDVHVYNNILEVHLVSQFDLVQDKAVTPYVVLKGGISRYYTNLVIEDPSDEYDCHPLDQDILQSSIAPSGSLGLGLKYDLAQLNKNWSKDRFFLDFSSTYTTGSNVRYMNVNKPPTNRTVTYDDVKAKFINNQSQVIHEHHVGYVYHSPIQMFNFRLGIMLKFR